MAKRITVIIFSLYIAFNYTMSVRADIIDDALTLERNVISWITEQAKATTSLVNAKIFDDKLEGIANTIEDVQDLTKNLLTGYSYVWQNCYDAVRNVFLNLPKSAQMVITDLYNQYGDKNVIINEDVSKELDLNEFSKAINNPNCIKFNNPNGSSNGLTEILYDDWYDQYYSKLSSDIVKSGFMNGIIISTNYYRYFTEINLYISKSGTSGFTYDNCMAYILSKDNDIIAYNYANNEIMENKILYGNNSSFWAMINSLSNQTFYFDYSGGYYNARVRSTNNPLSTSQIPIDVYYTFGDESTYKSYFVGSGILPSYTTKINYINRYKIIYSNQEKVNYYANNIYNDIQNNPQNYYDNYITNNSYNYDDYYPAKNYIPAATDTTYNYTTNDGDEYSNVINNYIETNDYTTGEQPANNYYNYTYVTHITNNYGDDGEGTDTNITYPTIEIPDYSEVLTNIDNSITDTKNSLIEIKASVDDVRKSVNDGNGILSDILIAITPNGIGIPSTDDGGTASNEEITTDLITVNDNIGRKLDGL